MGRAELVRVIESYQVQGYAIDDIRNSLVNLGYPALDVDDAINSLGGHGIPKIVFVIIALAVLIIFLAVVYIVISPGSADVLQMVTTPISPSLKAGSNLVFTKIIDYGGVSPEIEVVVNSEVKSVQSQSVVAGISETVTVRKRKESRTTLAIPAASKAGRYQVTVDAAYGSARAKNSFFITVAASETPPEKRCPSTCEDYNQCTLDSCKEGSCVHETVRPCCGNGVCEEGETCSGDCTADVIRGSKDSVVDQAIKIAKSSPDNAADLCQSVSRQSDADQCFSEVAKISRDSTLCVKIGYTPSRDSCIMDFVVSRSEFTLCDKIEDPWLRNSCFSYRKLKSGPVEFS